MSATLSDGTHAVANGDPNGDRTVKNIVEFVSRQQYTNSKQQNLLFKTKNSSAYSKRYEGSTDERTMTFLPNHTGKKIQIDFSRFDIMYSSSTTLGVRAEFAVYSGHDKTGTLLWKLDSHEAASGRS